MQPRLALTHTPSPFLSENLYPWIYPRTWWSLRLLIIRYDRLFTDAIVVIIALVAIVAHSSFHPALSMCDLCVASAWHLRGICLASAWHHSSCIILASSSAVSPQLARSYVVRLIREHIPKVRRRIESSVKSPLSQFFLRLSRSLFTSRKRQGLCLYLLERWY